MGNLDQVDFSGVAADAGAGSEGGGWYVKPDGWYRVMVTDAPVKENSAGTGKVVHAKLTHLEGQYDGRYEMAFFNVSHPTAKAQEIGLAQLKSLAIATGHPEPDALSDTSDLLARPFMVRLYSKPDGGKYSDADGRIQVIGGYQSIDEWMSSGGASDGPPPHPVQAPSPGGEPPPLGDDDLPF